MSVIGIMPDADGPEPGRLLLSANHLGGLTGGAAVGLDTEENLLTLNLRLAGLDGAVLAATIKTMAEVTESWRANLHLLVGIDRGADGGADGGGRVRM